MTYLFFTLIGVLGGAVASFAGIGGGIIVVPILVYLMNIDIKTASGISMVNIFFSTLFGSLFYYFQKSINIRLSIYLGLSAISFSFLGAYFSKYFSNLTLTITYFFVAVVSIILLFIRKKLKSGSDKKTKIKIYKLIPVGVFAGFAAGLLGIGGGFLFVPALIFFGDMPLKIAIGTSLGAVFITSIAGLIGKVIFIEFDYLTAVLVGIGGILGSRIGTYLNKKTKSIIIKYTFTLVMAVTLIRVIIDIFNYF